MGDALFHGLPMALEDPIERRVAHLEAAFEAFKAETKDRNAQSAGESAISRRNQNDHEKRIADVEKDNSLLRTKMNVLEIENGTLKNEVNLLKTEMAVLRNTPRSGSSASGEGSHVQAVAHQQYAPFRAAGQSLGSDTYISGVRDASWTSGRVPSVPSEDGYAGYVPPGTIVSSYSASSPAEIRSQDPSVPFPQEDYHAQVLGPLSRSYTILPLQSPAQLSPQEQLQYNEDHDLRWVFYNNSRSVAQYEPFDTLPQSVRIRLQGAYTSRFKDTKAHAEKHARCVSKNNRRRMAEHGTCFDQRIFSGRNPDDGQGKEACSRCFRLGKLCFRIVQINNEFAICLFPRKDTAQLPLEDTRKWIMA